MPGAASDAVVLDFETTGLSARDGDRVIEIGAVRITNGEIVARFQRLVNPGFRVSSFISSYTGITNSMLERASDGRSAFRDLIAFVNRSPIVAHNVGFDRRFLEAECENFRIAFKGQFLCSLLLARRIYQNVPNHRLATLVACKRIEQSGDFHRALGDSEMTARLWLRMLDDLKSEHGWHEPHFHELQRFAGMPKRTALNYLATLSQAENTPCV